jgi:hypothetical protein
MSRTIVSKVLRIKAWKESKRYHGYASDECVRPEDRRAVREYSEAIIRQSCTGHRSYCFALAAHASM